VQTSTRGVIDILGRSSFYSHDRQCYESFPIQHIDSRLHVSQVSETIDECTYDTYSGLYIVITFFALQQVPGPASVHLNVDGLRAEAPAEWVGRGIVQEQHIGSFVSKDALVVPSGILCGMGRDEGLDRINMGPWIVGGDSYTYC
jgi:hypothetical protein